MKLNPVVQKDYRVFLASGNGELFALTELSLLTACLAAISVPCSIAWLGGLSSLVQDLTPKLTLFRRG